MGDLCSLRCPAKEIFLYIKFGVLLNSEPFVRKSVEIDTLKFSVIIVFLQTLKIFFYPRQYIHGVCSWVSNRHLRPNTSESTLLIYLCSPLLYVSSLGQWHLHSSSCLARNLGVVWDSPLSRSITNLSANPFSLVFKMDSVHPCLISSTAFPLV